MSVIYFQSGTIQSDTEGRTVYGIAVPYGQTIVHSDPLGRAERLRFAHGVLSRSIAQRGTKVKLFTMHDTSRLPVGKAVELREESDGLHAAFELARTRDGDEALELVRSGTVDMFSIGYDPIRTRDEHGVTVHTEGRLREVSLVAEGAFPGAVVEGVYSAHPSLSVEIARRRLDLTLRTW